MTNLLKRLARTERPARPEDDTPSEQSLDETIESTFPASDPPSTIPAPEPDLEHTGGRNVRDEDAPPRGHRTH